MIINEKEEEKKSTYFSYFKRVRFQTFECLHEHKYYVLCLETEIAQNHMSSILDTYSLIALKYIDPMNFEICHQSYTKWRSFENLEAAKL